jgi:hypothetical protein
MISVITATIKAAPIRNQGVTGPAEPLSGAVTTPKPVAANAWVGSAAGVLEIAAATMTVGEAVASGRAITLVGWTVAPAGWAFGLEPGWVGAEVGEAEFTPACPGVDVGAGVKVCMDGPKV